jgi:hypothetical protein
VAALRLAATWLFAAAAVLLVLAAKSALVAVRALTGTPVVVCTWKEVRRPLLWAVKSNFPVVSATQRAAVFPLKVAPLFLAKVGPLS